MSVYTGGNLTIKTMGESEGTMVVDGNIVNTNGTPATISGKAIWGMGYYAPAEATNLAVGGNVSNTGVNVYSGGNTRVGGYAEKLKPNTTKVAIENHHTDWEWMYRVRDGNYTVRTNLGKTQALQVDTDGDGKTDLDYNNYVSKTLIPLSDNLMKLPTTGTVTYGRAKDVPNLGWGVAYRNPLNPNDKRANPYRKVTIKNEGLLIFTGDGQNHRQVFTLDANTVAGKAIELGTNKGWSLDFRNIPDGQAIIINVTGSPSINWYPGWRVYVNGVDYSTAVNKRDQSLSRYRSIASRIMWNYPYASNLRLNGGPIYQYSSDDGATGNWYVGGTESGQTNDGVLFPGSILLPRGSFYDIADTNGRILVGKDLTFNIWEHHNAPWVGFDEPQCFAVNGKTTASLS